MAMTRAELAAELWGDLQRQFVKVGITNTDDSGNLKEPIDATLRALGVAHSDLTGVGDLVADGDEDKALVAAHYYGLRIVRTAALGDVDKSASAPGVSRSANQYVKDLEAEVALAKAAMDAALVPAWGVGTINLDYIEPCPVEDAS